MEAPIQLPTDFVSEFVGTMGLGVLFLCMEDSDVFAQKFGLNFAPKVWTAVVPLDYLETAVPRYGVAGKTLILCQRPSVQHSTVAPEMFGPGWHWLVPATAEDKEETFADLPLRLDSNFHTYRSNESKTSIMVEERYKVKSGPLLKQELLVWEEEKFARLAPSFKWSRRHLGGAVLTDAIVDFHGGWLSIYRVQRGGEGELESVSGLVPGILSALGRELNFTTTVVSVADASFGTLEPDGVSWDGAVGMLQRGEADVSSTGLTMTPERSRGADFTLGLLRDVSTVALAADGGARRPVNMKAYLDIFPLSAWLALLGLFLLFVAVSAVARMTKARQDKANILAGLAAGSSVGFTTALQLGSPDFESPSSSYRYNLAEKVAFCSFASACMVMFAHFEGNLTAFMTAEAPPPEINSFQDLLDREMSLVVARGTSNSMYLQTAAEPGTALSQLEIVEVGTMEEELAEVEKGRVSFMPLLSSLQFTSLRFVANFQDRTESYLALGLRKDSELRGAFDYHLLRMSQTGLLSEMTHRILYETRPEDNSPRFFVAEASPLGYANLSFPALMLSAGAAVGVGLSIMERLIRRKRRMERLTVLGGPV